MIFWDYGIFKEKKDKTIDEHIRNINKQRIDLFILKDGEMVGEENLFEEGNK